MVDVHAEVGKKFGNMNSLGVFCRVLSDIFPEDFVFLVVPVEYIFACESGDIIAFDFGLWVG